MPDSPDAKSASVILIFLLVLSGLHFPEDIYDDPFPVELADMHVIDPVTHLELDRCRTTDHVENGHILLLLSRGRLLARTATSSLHEGHRAHLPESALSFIVRPNDSFGEIGM